MARSDVRALARLHRHAFPSFFLSQLGEAFLVQFYAGFLEDPTAVSVVARNGDNGVIQGAVVGTTMPAGFFRRLLKRRWLGFLLAGLRAAASKPSSIPRLLRGASYRGDTDDVPNAALLSSICVDPGSQGSGVGRELVARWLEIASRRGASHVVLTTDAVGNDAVNRFYTDGGWRLERTYQTHEGRVMNRYGIVLGGSGC